MTMTDQHKITNSAKLTIFEGPDGGGKTTAAIEFAEATGARYVHFGPLPNVKEGLARIYVEAMMPALLGYQDVVFDRSWLSEVPYGLAFRNGRDRLGDLSRRMLERLAFRCGAVVIYCLPRYNVVRSNYLSRKEIEYLENESQLQHVYETYASQATHLPRRYFDYKKDGGLHAADITRVRAPCHDITVLSAGNWAAPNVIVGQDFGNHKNQDAFYQWPFASFSDQGCSRWLTGQLEMTGVLESDLLWVNADQDLKRIIEPGTHKGIVALGAAAAQALDVAGFECQTVPHPSYWRRFSATHEYPLNKFFRRVA